MSEAYIWTELRQRACEVFRDAPSAQLEQRVIDVFRDHPALVVEAVEHVGRRFHAGQVRAPWVVLAKHVEEAMRPLEHVTASDERDRTRAVARAEQWMRAAGQHFDREPEIEEELFGERGALRVWRDDEALRARLVKLWRECRVQGEMIERQELERANRWKAGPTSPVRAPDPEPVDDPEPVPA